MYMETNIQKWGNSLGVRLPKAIASRQLLKAGSRVRVTETKAGIVIEVLKKQSLTLSDMVKHITKDNIHSEIEWGTPRGNEIW